MRGLRAAAGGAVRRTLAIAGTTAIFAGVIGTGSAVAAPWGFEQVTPPVKGSGAISYVDTFRASPDGNSFLYTTNSQFDSLPTESQPLYTRYIGHRGPDAWSNRPLDAPFDAGPGGIQIMSVVRSSYGLGHVMVSSTIAKTPGAIEGGGNVYLRNTRTGEYTLVAAHPRRELSSFMTTNYGSSSALWIAPDGQEAIFASTPGLVPGAPENVENVGLGGAIYSWTAEDGIEALTVMPESEGGAIEEAGSTGHGTEQAARESLPRYNALDHFYFSPREEGDVAGGVYERTDGVTYPISYSRVTNDPSEMKKADVLAVSEGGEHMLFKTYGNTPLTADTPVPDEEGLWVLSYLYRYNQADKSIDYVGTIGNYGTAIQMTRDGQTVSFESFAKLTEDAIQTEANYYVWRDGEIQLAASMEPTASGPGGAHLRVMSENGRYLSFTSNSARLAEQFDQENLSENCPPMFEAGIGPCDQVYLFDADAPAGEQLHCVSCRPDGAAPAGNSGDPMTSNMAGTMRMDNHQMQTVANDGTTFFTTKDGLLPEDGNELEDVYAYEDGELRLLSRARMGMASRFLEATHDGKTVFIATNDPIVGTDDDEDYDIYMTREGAGYPFNAVVAVPPCDGLEACRGTSPSPPASAPSGSEFFHGRSNPSTAPGVVRLAKVAMRGPVASLRVKVSGKGRLTATGSGLKKATKATRKAAVYKLQIKLSPKARKALNRKGTLKKKVRVTFTPTEGRASSVARTLTFNAPANGKVN
ncbi:MAG TPA: hypothetical protein VD761_06685 [Solirubrobacterales bacterium]|nr:hypothetical protein [Solirubrobacterales bacterium]